MINITKIFVTVFYAGYFKILPGTFASFISIILLFPIIEFKILSKGTFIFIFILIFISSLFFIKRYSDITKSHDSSKIVIDEFLGIYLILIFYDEIFIFNSFVTLSLVFLIFRFFDINKIFPANIIDKKMNNSLGVVLDDLVASIYSIIFLFILNVFL